jgi:hypothetical protein
MPRSVLNGCRAEQPGRADTRMTERHYAHLAPSYVADTVRAAFGNMGLAPDGRNVVPLPVGEPRYRPNQDSCMPGIGSASAPQCGRTDACILPPMSMTFDPLRLVPGSSQSRNPNHRQLFDHVERQMIFDRGATIAARQIRRVG